MNDPAAHCLNCGAALAPDQSWCASCGQKADTHRLSLHDLLHAVVHVFTHADHSVFSLVRDLALRPGRVAREYIDGRRRKYFNPFTFVLVVVGVASLVVVASGFVDFNQVAGHNPVTAFLQRHINFIILLQLPLLAGFSMLLFRSARLNFTEHLVLAAYTSGFRSIVFTLVVAPFWSLTHWHYNAVLLGYLSAWLVYFGVACAQCHEGNRWVLWLKGVLVASMAQAVVVGLVTLAILGASFQTPGN